MTYIRNFLRFWYDFIVGDDWFIAAGIVVIMVAAWLLDRAGIPAWWLFSLAVAGLLLLVVKRAAKD